MPSAQLVCGAAGNQRAQRGEHHRNNNVLHAQLTPSEEEGAERLEVGVMSLFHGADSFARH